ncbi:MAG: thermonuclease family protein [Myxococcales bacterium]|nr:thermonuclease family protein [Myxococcales bacterium]
MILPITLWGLAALAEPASPTPDAPTTHDVRSVYDGDTVTLSNGDKVRLLGANTPEMRPLEPYAQEAQQFAERFVMGQPVTLIPDDDDRDGYGRILADLGTPEGTLSEALLREGLAHVFLIPPVQGDPAALLAAEAHARSQRLGIWSIPRMQGGFLITSFHANAPGDDNDNVNGEYLRLCNVSGETADTAGWRLMDLSGDTHTLPRLEVPAGHTVTVRSGVGKLQSNPARQLMIFLGSSRPLWNNREEHVVLYAPDGSRVDERRHKGRSR